VLPPLVANQIAAGEVVERPASVVKELVENALDAGATRITVEIEQGGIELIRITDDGWGIPAEELALAVAPHATSKIRDAGDLDRVGTMGFRGEALASIVSVSRLSIRSRTADQAGAMRLDCEGAEQGEPRPEAGPVGTCVTVRNLFFNTPARRKFLRTPQTEQGHCADVVREIAMSHAAVAFEMRADGRVLLDLPRTDSPRERVLAVLGRELESQYLEAHADEFEDVRGVALWGLVAVPALAKPSPKWQHVFLNGRAIRDKTIQHAFKEAYRGLIEPGKHPAGVLMLEMDPGAVDVNVHPAKAEVRFRDSSMVHSVVYRSVREALRSADLTPTLDRSWGSGGGPEASDRAAGADRPSATAHVFSSGSRPPVLGRADTADRFISHLRNLGGRGGGEPKFDFAAMREAMTSRAEVDEIAGAELIRAAGQPAGSGATRHPVPEDHLRASRLHDAPGQGAMPGALPARTAIQVHNSYIVTHDEQGLLIIDQHALHERVMFEKLRARIAPGDAQEPRTLESQRLLMPAAVKATTRAIDALESLGPLLERLGIAAAAIGPDAIGVHAFPTFLFDRNVDPAEFMADLVERIETDPAFTLVAPVTPPRIGASFPAARVETQIANPKPQTPNPDPLLDEALLHEVLDMMACKAAVKAGDPLTPEEIDELLALRESVERSTSCPHGRPTTIRVTIRELEKLFGRV